MDYFQWLIKGMIIEFGEFVLLAFIISIVASALLIAKAGMIGIVIATMTGLFWSLVGFILLSIFWKETHQEYLKSKSKE